jgi:LAO/AO transport system kinase
VIDQDRTPDAVRALDAGLALAAAASAGDRRALGRLLTEVEGRTLAARAALEALYPMAGVAHLLGITGPPGAGKSTLVTALVAAARGQGRTVAVLAVDPSSPITGGALLGDRVRMQQHAADDGVFIRSMAARGHAGGLAVATMDAASVLDACGFGLVLIETVGTGQGEVEIASLADTTVVVQAPEMGDEVQALKAGLLEVADIVAVTKADRPGADRAAAALRAMLTVGAQQDAASGDRPRPHRPEVLLVSALTGAGVPELLAAIDRRAPGADGSGSRGAAARARAEMQLLGIVVERVRVKATSGPARARLDEAVEDVAAHRVDPYAAADGLLDALLGEVS